MAKWVSDVVLDGALNIIKNTANLMVAVPSQPADFAAAQAAKLADVAMAPGDFTLSAGATSGRRLQVAAKAGVAIDASGAASHVALLDTANSRLLYVTTCPSQSLFVGGIVSFDAWELELRAPA